MVVQLLYFPDCPNVDSARAALREALSSFPDAFSVSEIDVTEPGAPAHLRSCGSPTILVDGVDVAGEEPTGSCCRLYGVGEARSAPAPALLRAALERASRTSSA